MDDPFTAIQEALAGLVAAADTEGPKERVALAAGLQLLGTGLEALVRIAAAQERLADVAEAQELRHQHAQMELAAQRGGGQVVPFPGCNYQECAYPDRCAAARTCVEPAGAEGWSASTTPPSAGA